MRREWNELQAWILNIRPYAYYVHCMAHRLQLALVGASREVVPIHQFFNKLSSIVNIVGASCKRRDKLKAAQAENIAHLLSIDELESGTGLNQIGILQRLEDTWWSSYLRTVSSLINMFSATCEVLMNIINDGFTPAQVADADTAYEILVTFDFVFILHLMQAVFEISDILCRALQSRSQYILHAMHLVAYTKSLIQKLRDNGFVDLIERVKSFCKSVNIPILDLNAQYLGKRGRARRPEDVITMEHYYKVDIFMALIDKQLHELNSRFNDHTLKLLFLNSALDPKEIGDSFRIADICQLIHKFYPQDFSEHEKTQLQLQLEHFDHMRQLRF